MCISLHMSVGTYIGVCTRCRNGCVVLTTCRVDEVYMEAAKCTATLSNLLENVGDAAIVNAASAVCQSLSLCALLSSDVHHVQATCAEILCDVLKKEVEEALTSNVGPTQPAGAPVWQGRLHPSVVCPFHMQGKCFQEKAFLGHVLTPSPVFTKSKKDPLGTKRYAAYMAIRGFPELSYSAVNTCHVSQTPAEHWSVLFCLISFLLH